MKMIMSLLNTPLRKSLFALSFICLSNISCTKEYSLEGAIPPGNDSISVSIFNSQIPTAVPGNDSTIGIELGLRFQSTVAGMVTGIKFYKNPGNLGTHTGQLYTSGGKLLASQVFINETDSGWQTVLFANAVPIAADTTYIAAYYSSLGNYFSTNYGLTTAIVNGPLIALADGTDGINGIFKYTITPDFPDSGWRSSNYWIDVIEKIQNK